MPETASTSEPWAQPLSRTTLSTKLRAAIGKAATVAQIPEEEILDVFLTAANAPEAIEKARRVPGAASKWTEKTRLDYQMGRRTAAAWQTVWDRWPEGHDRYTRDWAEDNSARRSAGLDGKGQLNPWSGREGWESEPEIPIRHKDAKGHDGKYHRQPVEPGYLTYNRLITERHFRPFRTASNEPRVAVPSSHGLEIHDPADQEFAKRIGYVLYTLQGEPIPFRDLTVAGTTLTSRALSRALPAQRTVELWLRVAPFGIDSSWIDMRDSEQRCIAVGPDGWRIEQVGHPIFDPRSHMLPLPTPDAAGEDGGWRRIEGLWRFVRLPSPDGRSDQQLLALASLVEFILAPSSPKPVTLLNGPEGIGKSGIAATLQGMVDPSRVAVVTPPKEDEELINIAVNHAVINLDNVSYIRGETSDTLSRLCTGTGLVKRELYSNTGEVALSVRRWVILNGITAVPRLPDLLSRIVFLDPQEPELKIGPEPLKQMFHQERPRLLAGLLDLSVSTARILRDDPPSPCSDRMADYVRIGRAMAVAMGRSADDFNAAWRANAAAQVDAATEDPWVELLSEYFGRQQPGFDAVRPDDIASWINQERRSSLGKEVSGQHVGNAIARSTKTLQRLGIRVGKRRDHSGRAVYGRVDSVQETLPEVVYSPQRSQALSVRNPDNETPNGGEDAVSPLRPQQFGVSAGEGGSQPALRPQNGGSAGSQRGSQPPRPSEDTLLLSPQRPLSRKVRVEGGEEVDVGVDPGDLLEGRSTRADRARAAGIIPTIGTEWANDACSRCQACTHAEPNPDCTCSICSPWGHSNTAVGSRTHFCGVLP